MNSLQPLPSFGQAGSLSQSVWSASDESFVPSAYFWHTKNQGGNHVVCNSAKLMIQTVPPPLTLRVWATKTDIASVSLHGYGWALRVRKMPPSSPARWMCGRKDLEQRLFTVLHRRATEERSMKLHNKRVGFFHGSPNWQQSRAKRSGLYLLINRSMEGIIQAILLWGFSST